jgi:hypothetical protein
MNPHDNKLEITGAERSLPILILSRKKFPNSYRELQALMKPDERRG